MYKEFLRKFDWFLFAAVFLLVVLSLATIYSITLSQEQLDFLFFKKQLIFAIIGFVAMGVLTALNYTAHRSSAFYYYALSGLLLLFVLFFGVTVRGTSGWFDFGAFSFQPVEFTKLALVIVFARFFSKNLKYKRSERLLISSVLIVVAPIVLVLFQPDFGSAMLLFGLWCALILSLGIRRLHLIIATVAIVITSLFSWWFLTGYYDSIKGQDNHIVFKVVQEYQIERVLIFFDSSRDPWGSGYNIRQAIIAIGSGQLFGRGLGFGAQSQLKFLPESQTDFIFAVIAEELGFFAVLFMLICFGVIFYRGFKIGFKSKDNFAFILALGITFLIFIETVINISMNLGLFPVAGLTLPFLSYGGSSLIIHMMMIGILQSIAVRR
ncbi:MAG: rod shape-determining protein RodA [Patescibacteria group bacterium]|nr:rod shape-determining protein RodA [Patescibacteria group bacterium]